MTDEARHGPAPGRADSAGTEPSTIPPDGVDIGRIVAHLAEQSGRDRSLAGHLDPTWDDVRAALVPGHPDADGGSGEAENPPGPPTFQTPQAFYAEAIRRPDIRRILEALAD